MTAVRAGVAMTAQRCGATAQNGTKGFELLKAKAGSIPVQEAIAVRAKNVGHLEGGPSHFSFFRLLGTGATKNPGQFALARCNRYRGRTCARRVQERL